MNDLNPDPPPPPDAALPVEVEECPMDCEWSREQAATLRTHIAALTAQNAALTAERDALRAKVAEAQRIRYPCGHLGTTLEAELAVFSECLPCQAKRANAAETERDALRGERDWFRSRTEWLEKNETRRARREALEWAKDRLPSLAAWPTGKLIHALFEAEITRLKAQGEAPPL